MTGCARGSGEIDFERILDENETIVSYNFIDLLCRIGLCIFSCGTILVADKVGDLLGMRLVNSLRGLRRWC